MKQFYFLLMIIFSFNSVRAQNVGIGTNTPANGAILDLNSTSKALLLPRLTTSKRDSITNPVPGMLIYNTDSNRFQGCVKIDNNIISYFLRDTTGISPSLSFPCCANSYVEFFPLSTYQLKKITLILYNLTATNQVLRIRLNSGSDTASAIIPPNTNTPTPIDFIFYNAVTMTANTPNFINIDVANGNVNWAASGGSSAYTSICGNGGTNFGLAYKTYSESSDNGLKDAATNYSAATYPCCLNGYVEFFTTSSYPLNKVQLLLKNTTNVNQNLQIGIADFSTGNILGTASVSVLANTNTPSPYDFVFLPNFNLNTGTPYKIFVVAENQNVLWQGTNSSPYTSICLSSGFTFGLAYKLFTQSLNNATKWVNLHE